MQRASWLATYGAIRLLLDLDGRKWPPALGPGNGALRFQCTAKLVADGGIVGEHYTPPLDERTPLDPSLSVDCGSSAQIKRYRVRSPLVRAS